MAIQGNVEIKVKDDALLSAASTLKDRISDMRSSYDKVMEIVQKTGGYWIGLAGDAHRSAFLEQQDDIDQIVRRLSEHPDDLLDNGTVNFTVTVKDWETGFSKTVTY